MKSRREALDFVFGTNEREALDCMRRAITLLDSCREVPGGGIQFGLDSILGMVPVVGDVLSARYRRVNCTSAATIGVLRPPLS